MESTVIISPPKDPVEYISSQEQFIGLIIANILINYLQIIIIIGVILLIYLKVVNKLTTKNVIIVCCILAVLLLLFYIMIFFMGTLTTMPFPIARSLLEGKVILWFTPAKI